MPSVRPLLALFAAALCLASVPPAEAQLEVLVDPPVEVAVTVGPSAGGPIRPVLDIGTATATIEVTCTAPGIYTKPVEVIHNVQSATSFGSGFVVDFVQEVEFAPEECKAETATRSYTVEVDVQFSSQAPAFEENEFTFVATANTTEGRGTWTETVGFAGTLTARLTQGFREENGTVPIVGEITNNANGAVEVTVEVSGAPSNGRLEPADLTVKIASGATSAVRAPFRLDYVPTERALDSFTLRFAARAQEDAAAQLDPYMLDVTLDPKNEAIYSSGSTEKGSPAASVSLLVGALAGLVAWRRRP